MRVIFVTLKFIYEYFVVEILLQFFGTELTQIHSTYSAWIKYLQYLK